VVREQCLGRLGFAGALGGLFRHQLRLWRHDLPGALRSEFPVDDGPRDEGDQEDKKALSFHREALPFLAPQCCQHLLELFGKGRGELEYGPRVRVWDRELLGVEKDAAQSEVFTEFAVDALVAVLSVAKHGVSDRGKVNADLMSSAGAELDTQEAGLGQSLDHLVFRVCDLGLDSTIGAVSRHPGACILFLYLHIDDAARSPNVAVHEGDIAFFHLAHTKKALEDVRGPARFGEDDHTAGTLVETVGERRAKTVCTFEGLGNVCLYQIEKRVSFAMPSRGMDDHSSRFVENQDALVFMQGTKETAKSTRIPQSLQSLFLAVRRRLKLTKIGPNLDSVAELESGARGDAAAADDDRSLAEKLLEQGVRQPGKMSAQETIQALVPGVFVDLNEVAGLRRHGSWTVSCLQNSLC